MQCVAKWNSLRIIGSKEAFAGRPRWSTNQMHHSSFKMHNISHSKWINLTGANLKICLKEMHSKRKEKRNCLKRISLEDAFWWRRSLGSSSIAAVAFDKANLIAIHAFEGHKFGGEVISMQRLLRSTTRWAWQETITTAYLTCVCRVHWLQW